jgi:hypothetical protein
MDVASGRIRLKNGMFRGGVEFKECSRLLGVNVHDSAAVREGRK